MKPEELRIGNFVTIKLIHKDQQGTITALGKRYTTTFSTRNTHRASLNGDWVTYVTGHHANYKTEKNRAGLEAMMIYVEPIPLTASWLEKFGFVKNISDGIWWINKHKYQQITIIPPNNEDGFFSPAVRDNHQGAFGLYGIKYVHQLQNLFYALTGDELEMKENAKV